MHSRILIADDRRDVLDALRLLLKGHGYNRTSFAGGFAGAVARQESIFFSLT